MTTPDPQLELTSTGQLPPAALDALAALLIDLPPSGGTCCEHPGCCALATETATVLGCLRHVCSQHAPPPEDHQP